MAAEWFAGLLHGSLVATLTDSYGTSARSAVVLDVVAARRGTTLSDDDREEILGTIRRFEPHAEVAAALGSGTPGTGSPP